MKRPDRWTVQRVVKARQPSDGTVLWTSDLVAALQAATGCSRASAYRALQAAGVSEAVRKRAPRPSAEDVRQPVRTLRREGNSVIRVPMILAILLRRTGCSR